MGAPTKLKFITVHLPDGMREKINQHAKALGYKVTADYVRHLISADMGKNGELISLDVRRGKPPKEGGA